MASEYIIGLGSERDPHSLPLFTRARNRIPNSQRKQRVPAIMQEAARLLTTSFPQIRLRSLSSTYDCVGLVFASRRTAIGAENIEPILRDDGYYRLPNREDVRCGDLVLYRAAGGEPTHVAIIVGINRTLTPQEISFDCLSQWGEDGEYFHPEHAVSTYFGTHREFWTERIPRSTQ